MLPADDIIINILLCSTVATLYGSVICLLVFVLTDGDLILVQLKHMRDELEHMCDEMKLNNEVFNQVADNAKK